MASPRKRPLASDLNANPRRIGGRWFWPSGYSAPIIAGGSGTEGDPAPNPAPKADPPADPKPDPAPTVTLTQADVDRATAEAKKAAIAEVAQTLGCSVADAKKLVEAQRAAEDAQKTEAQRAREAADAEKAAAATERQAAAAERRQLQVERALVGAKVRDDRHERAVRLVLAEIDDKADADGIKAAVKKFADETPEWFGEAKTTPGSDPGGRGPGGGGQEGKTGMDAGRERARADMEKVRNTTRNPFDGYTVIGGPGR
jgi:DNA-binding transcriptional MerR regulator